MSELNRTASPCMDRTETGLHLCEPGMTIRQHAAITMRVPMSGDQELDEMIREARRLDMAAKAMQGFAANGCGWDNGVEGMARCSYEWADALLAASEPKKDEPETCIWSEEDGESCCWNTSCGEAFILNDGTPSQNSVRFCHSCGKPVSEKRWTYEGDDADSDPQPDAEGWIEWKGGECPVQKGTAVVVRYRDGGQSGIIPALELLDHLPRDASRCFWECDYIGNDIIAYRIVKE